jgi:hypothetical protein
LCGHILSESDGISSISEPTRPSIVAAADGAVALMLCIESNGAQLKGHKVLDVDVVLSP